MGNDKATDALVRAQGDEVLLGDAVVLTQLDRAIGWARKYSIFPYPFATACCAMEYMSLSMTPYDIDRFGALLPRFSPRQADLLMVIGTVTRQTVGSVAVGARPWGIGISPDGTRLYTANGPSNDVTVVDAKSLRVITKIKAGNSPWGVAVH